jgi:hypothetical protein
MMMNEEHTLLMRLLSLFDCDANYRPTFRGESTLTGELLDVFVSDEAESVLDDVRQLLEDEGLLDI